MQNDLEICNSFTLKQTNPWLLVIWTCNLWQSSTRHAHLPYCSRGLTRSSLVAAAVLKPFYCWPLMLLPVGFMATDSSKGRRAWPKGLQRKQTVNSAVKRRRGSSSATLTDLKNCMFLAHTCYKVQQDEERTDFSVVRRKYFRGKANFASYETFI